MSRFLGKTVGRKSKIFLYIITSLSLLLILAWAILYYYVYVNKKPLLHKIHKSFNEQFQGTIEIKDLELVFWKDFPTVALGIYNVTIYDSLYHLHHRPYIHAEELRLSVQLSSIFSENLIIEKIGMHQGKINIFTDTNGYSNKHVFQPKFIKQPAKDKQSKSIHVYFLDVQDVQLSVIDSIQDKHIEATIHSWEGSIENSDTYMSLSSALSAHVQQLGFNLKKGAFLIDKPVEAELSLIFNKALKKLVIPTQTFLIDSEPIDITMLFNFGDKPNHFKVIIEDESIPFTTARSFLNHHIAKHFTNLNIAAPLSATCMITGFLKPKDLPWAYVKWSVEHTTINSEYGNIDSATFSGIYFNNYELDKGNVDSNTIIYVPKITGLYNGNIPFYGDSIIIHGFKKPHLRASIFSKFKVNALNELLGNAFQFKEGTANAHLRFSGNINTDDTSRRSLFGYIQINNTNLQYNPRNLKFNDVNLKLLFTGTDIIVDHIKMRAGRSNVTINGKVKQFMNAYFNNPEMVIVDWNVYSQHIDINDFTSFLIPRRKSSSAPASNKKKIQTLNQRIDDILAQGNMLLRLDIKKISMNKFHAEDLIANIHFLTDEIDLKNISVKHAQGFLKFNGNINQRTHNNPFTLNGTIQDVAIGDLFYGMNNFGMEAIKHDNIQGDFNATIDIKGNITDNATLLPHTLQGAISFQLRNGALINLPALQQIQKYVFKKRDLNNIRFNDIKNTLVIEQGKAMILPMAIESTALNVYLKGIYSFHKGTDISLEIPLRNPKKDHKRILKGLEPKNRRGLKVYLRAKETEDGSVKISWDPLNKGGDAVDAQMHLDDDGELKSDAAPTDTLDVNSPQATQSKPLEEILNPQAPPPTKKKKNILQRIKGIFVREKDNKE